MDPDGRETAVKKVLFLSVSCWCPVFTVSGAEYDSAKCEKYTYRDLCGEWNLRGKDQRSTASSGRRACVCGSFRRRRIKKCCLPGGIWLRICFAAEPRWGNGGSWSYRQRDLYLQYCHDQRDGRKRERICGVVPVFKQWTIKSGIGKWHTVWRKQYRSGRGCSCRKWALSWRGWDLYGKFCGSRECRCGRKYRCSKKRERKRRGYGGRCAWKLHFCGGTSLRQIPVWNRVWDDRAKTAGTKQGNDPLFADPDPTFSVICSSYGYFCGHAE